MKNGQQRVRVSGDQLAFLQKLADQTGIKSIEISTMLLQAAITAVQEGGKEVPFPVKFKVDRGEQQTSLVEEGRRGRYAAKTR